MSWNQEKIDNHIEAAQRLERIKNKVFLYIKNKKQVSEYEVHEFILSEFKKNNLETSENNCIVAFRENTSFVHYFPSQYCRKLKEDSLIMIDIWARFKKKNSPYADITWMAFKGKKIPAEIQKVFNLVIGAQNEAIKFIKQELKKGKLPIGKKVDEVARNFIKAAGLGAKFRHTLGHSLGMNHPHGKNLGLDWKNKSRLKKNIAYTIEPGVYLDNKFGIRSEIDFYIDNDLRFNLTTKRQNKIINI